MRQVGWQFSRFALVGALIAGLGLAACGRKGSLDPPPGASLNGSEAGTGGTASGKVGAAGGEGTAVPDKRIPLDALLD